MSLFGWLRAKPAKNTASVPATDPTKLVTVYDAFGREFKIPLAEWEKNVLPGSLAQAHDDPDKLSQIIIGSFHDGFFQQMIEPSRRLLEIDKDVERSTSIRAIVLMRTGDLSSAEKILSAYIKQFGPTGAIVMNLAQLYSEKGMQAQAELTLWQAVQCDPNLENALLWWANVQKEKTGEQGFWEAIQKAATLPGSWRPQLWLARRCLEGKQFEEAKRYYDQVLPVAADKPGVLTMITGDLGNNGHVAEIIELVLPTYAIEIHDPLAGLNLLQACLETKNYVEGEELLHRMLTLHRPDLKERLFNYSAEFEKLREAEAEMQPSPESPISVEIVPFDLPIWAYGLLDAKWLFQSERDRDEQIPIIPLANTTHTNLTEPTTHKEDEVGRLTRSIPLYLLESMYFWTSLKPKVVLPVVRGRGPVVAGAEWSADQILSFAEGSQFALTGTIELRGEELVIALSIWDCSRNRIANRFERTTSWNALGETVLSLEKEITGAIATSNTFESASESFYGRPDAASLMPYLTCLGQTVMLTLVQNSLLPKESIWGERNVLDYCLAHALQDPKAQVPKIMFLAALVKCHDFGSLIYNEFKMQALQLMENEKDKQSPFYRLSPILLRILDQELFHLRKAELLQDARGEYRTWLISLTLDSDNGGFRS